MKIHNILCPVDFSPCSNAAFEHAVRLAGCWDATVVAVHVVAPPPTYISGITGYGAIAPYQPEPDARLDRLEGSLDNVPLRKVSLVGLEGESIVKFAAETGCELIVLGTHGYNPMMRFMLGSVADYVIRHAKCPVFVVKDGKRERQARKPNFTPAIT